MLEIEKKLSLNMTSLSDVVKETTGRELEEVLKQIQIDDKLLEKYGINKEEILSKISDKEQSK